MSGGVFGLGIVLYRAVKWFLPPRLFIFFDNLRRIYFRSPNRTELIRDNIKVDRVGKMIWTVSGKINGGGCGRYKIVVSGKKWSKKIGITDMSEDTNGDYHFFTNLLIVSRNKLRLYLSTDEMNPVDDKEIFLSNVGMNDCKDIQYAATDVYSAVHVIKDCESPDHVPGSDSRTTVLYIHHQWDGGSTSYLRSRISEDVSSGRNAMVFSEDNGTFILEVHCKNSSEIWIAENIESVIDTIDGYDISEIVMNEATSFSNPRSLLECLQWVKDKHKAKMTLLVHDYYCVCPSFLLLNNKDCFCNPKKDITICDGCFNRNPNQQIRFDSIAAWRKMWGDFISECDEIRAFSKSSQTIIESVYDKKGNETIVPHKVVGIEPVPSHDGSQIIRIAVIGNMMKQKGSEMVREMCDIISARKLSMEIVHYGKTYCKPIKHLVERGPYKVSELSQLLEKDAIDMVMIPSIWPETFSYTAEEAMMTGLPVVVFDIGAPAERVKLYDHGIVIDKIDAAYAIDVIQSHVSV